MTTLSITERNVKKMERKRRKQINKWAITWAATRLQAAADPGGGLGGLKPPLRAPNYT